MAGVLPDPATEAARLAATVAALAAAQADTARRLAAAEQALARARGIGPRGRRRRRAAALALALLVALVPLGLLAAAPFDDLVPGSVHNANIDAIYAAGITTGCVPNAQYCPTANVSRQEMASFLARTAGLGGNPPVANARTAQTADLATNATSAANATNAQHAQSADTATSAQSATSALDAGSLGGVAAEKYVQTNSTAILANVFAAGGVFAGYGSGFGYRAIPIAFGTVSATGTLSSGTPNVSVALVAGQYEITIAGEPYYYPNYQAVATPIGSDPRLVGTGSLDGKLVVTIATPAGVATTAPFSFVVYKP